MKEIEKYEDLFESFEDLEKRLASRILKKTYISTFTDVLIGRPATEQVSTINSKLNSEDIRIRNLI